MKGCVILKPRGYALWDSIRRDLDARIAATGALNAYFPLLVPVSFLSREAQHVAGFATECAVVTHHRLCAPPVPAAASSSSSSSAGALVPDPSSLLAEPLVIRPTSEALVWDAFSRWVGSAGDLPLLINQWANVVRWERRTRPFLRTTEFLWQEGHTAHASAAEAAATCEAMLRLYAEHMRAHLAMPVFTGQKSASERFAGAAATHTCEALLQNGWALQAATAHDLGQHFAKAFGVSFRPAAGAGAGSTERQHVWGTSWGASTRLIGGLILMHSDDTGLVLPPAVAPLQVIVVAVGPKAAAASSGSSASSAQVAAAAHSCAEALRRGSAAAGRPLRVSVDADTAVPPGQRFYKWERQGVPLRLELGAAELAAGSLTLKGRLEGSAKQRCSSEPAALLAAVEAALAAVQQQLLARATERRDAAVLRGASYAELQQHAAAAAASSSSSSSENSATRAFLVPWADDAAAEAAVKAATKFTLRCFPDGGLQEEAAGKACFYSGRPATHMALFARAY